MKSVRKICVVTGSRAEYGLLRLLMEEVGADPDLRLQVIVTGMHLSPEFGSTYREIERDGFAIDTKVEMLLSADSAVGIAKSIGVGVIGFADALQRLQPDILVLLGDRFEIFAAAQVALIQRIPIAHIHGGESTEGAFDEGIRHAITKMAQWHFVAAEAYRKRVIQLGEAPERVFNFGAPGLDALERLAWMDREALQHLLGIACDSPLFLVTYHPATLGERKPLDAMAEVMGALERFPAATVILTYPNADTSGRELIALIHRWVARSESRARAFASLGQQCYLSVMRECDVVVGNSSSGIIEAPVLKKAAVNIGDRQKGRLKASSVIDAAEDREAIAAAIDRALSPQFRAGLAGVKSLYGAGGVSRRIKEQLKIVGLQPQKSFFDIHHDR